MILAAYNDGLYQFLLFFHILTVIVGIGGIALNGVYGIQAKNRPGPAGQGASEANYAVSMIAEKFIYAIPVFGILLVFASDDLWQFDQSWVWLSLVLYVAALGVAHGVLIPGHRRINTLLAEINSGPPPTGGPPPQVAELEAIGKRMAPAGAFTNLAAAAILYLMVVKPGL